MPIKFHLLIRELSPAFAWLKAIISRFCLIILSLTASLKQEIVERIPQKNYLVGVQWLLKPIRLIHMKYLMLRGVIYTGIGQFPIISSSLDLRKSNRILSRQNQDRNQLGNLTSYRLMNHQVLQRKRQWKKGRSLEGKYRARGDRGKVTYIKLNLGER